MKRNNPKRGGRQNVQVFTDDIVAIRKMRISRRITRKDAGKTIGVSAKTMERIENGRRNISDERLKQLLYESKLILNKLIHCLPREVFEVQRLASPPIQVRFSIEAETPIGSFLR